MKAIELELGHIIYDNINNEVVVVEKLDVDNDEINGRPGIEFGKIPSELIVGDKYNG